MRFHFDFKRVGSQAHTDGQDIYVHLQEVFSHDDLITVLVHEHIHATINKFKRTTQKQDHFIMKKLEVEWY